METPQVTEPAVKLRIDSLIAKNKINFFFAITTSFLLLIFFVAANVPDSFITQRRNVAEMINSVSDLLGYDEKPYSFPGHPVMAFRLDEFRTMNKFVAIKIAPVNPKEEEMHLTLNVAVSAFIIKDDEVEETIYSKDQVTLHFDCDTTQTETCNHEQVFQRSTITDQSIYLVLEILNVDEASSLVGGFRVESTTLNVNFRIYLLFAKFAIVAFTVLCFLWIFLKMRQLNKEFYIKEQKAFMFIAPALITINEPFTVYILEGYFYTWTTILNLLVFSSVLIWYWFSTMDHLAESDDSPIEKKPSDFPKLFALGYFVTLVFTFIKLGNLSIDQPTVDFATANDSLFEFLKVILYLVQLIGLGWVGTKIWKIIMKLGTLTQREQTFFWFSLFYLAFHFYIVSRGGPFIFSFDGTRVLLICGVSTLYVFSTLILHLPTQEGIGMAQHIKKYDNPAVKDMYKDLDLSDDSHRTPKLPKKEENNSNQGVHTLDGSADHKYPYENKHEDEL